MSMFNIHNKTFQRMCCPSKTTNISPLTVFNRPEFEAADDVFPQPVFQGDYVSEASSGDLGINEKDQR